MPKAIRPKNGSEWRSHRRYVLDRSTGREKYRRPLTREEMGVMGRILWDIYMPAITEELQRSRPLWGQILKTKGGHKPKSR